MRKSMTTVKWILAVAGRNRFKNAEMVSAPPKILRANRHHCAGQSIWGIQMIISEQSNCQCTVQYCICKYVFVCTRELQRTAHTKFYFLYSIYCMFVHKREKLSTCWRDSARRDSRPAPAWGCSPRRTSCPRRRSSPATTWTRAPTPIQPHDKHLYCRVVICQLYCRVQLTRPQHLLLSVRVPRVRKSAR